MNYVGRKCYIIDRESIYYNEWGIIKDFDGELYYIAIANGCSSLPVFERKQIRITKQRKDVNVVQMTI